MLLDFLSVGLPTGGFAQALPQFVKARRLTPTRSQELCLAPVMRALQSFEAINPFSSSLQEFSLIVYQNHPIMQSRESSSFSRALLLPHAQESSLSHCDLLSQTRNQKTH